MAMPSDVRNARRRKTNNLSIYFDAEECLQDFERGIIDLLNTFAKKIKQRAQDLAPAEVKHLIKTEEVKGDRRQVQRGLGIYISEVWAGGSHEDFAHVVMHEFGRGSMMVSSSTNPGLASYMESEYWNPLRQRNEGAITGWEKGKVHKSFVTGEMSKGTAGLEGLNLEIVAQRLRREGKEVPDGWEPLEPSLFLTNAFKENETQFLNALQTFFNTFEFHKYLKTTM